MTTADQSVDTVCTLVPYFRIAEGRVEQWRALVPEFVARAETEAGCVHYAFSFDGQDAHCREGYVDAAALLAHLENVADLLQQALTMSELVRLEVHGPADQIAALRGPMADRNAQFFTLERGFRR